MNKKIFLALDNLEKNEILNLVKELKQDVMFKINDAFVKYGPKLINEIHSLGGEIFLDLKFHDIPNTVANYSITAAKNKVFMFNVHTLGGYEMMRKARVELDAFCSENNLRKPLLVGVTILTSMNQEELNEIGINKGVENQVITLAKLAKKAGLDGVVCSPKEIEQVKSVCGKDFLTITPGIRPKWSVIDDQKRINTPKEAIEKGGDYLVIGRPIIQASNYGITKVEAAKKIIEEITN